MSLNLLFVRFLFHKMHNISINMDQQRCEILGKNIKYDINISFDDLKLHFLLFSSCNAKAYTTSTLSSTSRGKILINAYLQLNL